MVYRGFKSLALASLILWNLAAGLFAQNQAPEDNVKATAVARLIVDAMNRQGIDEALAVMTPSGVKGMAGRSMLHLLSASGVNAPPGTPKTTVPAEIEALVAKYGLAQAELPNLDAAMGTVKNAEEAAEKLLKHLRETNQAVVACVKPEQLREVVKEASQALALLPESPMVLELGELSVEGNSASVAVNQTLSLQASKEKGLIAAPTPFIYLVLIKKDGTWLFDGFDEEKEVELILRQPPPAGAGPAQLIDELEVTGKTAEGQTVSLADHKGKVVLVNFWGTWFEPCMAALPELMKLHEEFHGQGLEILGVAANDAASLKEFLAGTPLPWSNLVDGDAAITAKYGIQAFPTTLLIDQEGRHIATNLPAHSLRKAIQLLLSGESTDSITGIAAELLEAGSQKARSEKKLVFLRFTSAADPICQAFDSWMLNPEIRERLDKAFVDVCVDVQINAGAQQLMSTISPNALGIPYYAIWDAEEDMVLINCEAPGSGMIGLPSQKTDLEHFVKMFETTGRFTPEDLDLFRKTMWEIGSAFEEPGKQ